MEMNTPTSDSSSGDTSPKKYIRTFESDMRVFEEGGKPDLAPFKAPPPAAPAERPVEASPIAPSAPIKKISTPVEETPPPPPPQAPEEPKLAPIETYTNDFSQRMKETHASTMTVLAAEQDAAPEVPADDEVERKESVQKNVLYSIAGILFIVVGGIGIYSAYTRYYVAMTPVTVALSATAPIFVDSREQVSGTDAALLRAIGQSLGAPLALNAVRLLELADASTTDRTIFSALNLHTPGIVLRNIDSSGSMAGIVNASSGQSPFFILSVTSYSAVFSGMLSWESTMPGDTAGLFPPYLEAHTASSTATTTPIVVPSTTNLKIGFHDEVASNHDVRVYRDSMNRSVLLYGFWNQSTLVIARDSVAFAEIIGRLATSHALP